MELILTIIFFVCLVGFLGIKVYQLQWTNAAYLEMLNDANQKQASLMENTLKDSQVIFDKFSASIGHIDALVENQKKIIENQKTIESHLKLKSFRG